MLDAHPDLAARFHARLEKSLGEAAEILNDKRETLDRLTAFLFEQQVLDGEMVIDILDDRNSVASRQTMST